MRGKLYCLTCRTCPHDWRYQDFWDPPCTRCVRDLHVILTFDGPRIRDVELYVQDALRRGVKFDDILTCCFEEQEALERWSRPRNEPFNTWTIDYPPHFDLKSEARRSSGTGSASAPGRRA